MLCTRCQSIDFRSAPLLHDLEKPGFITWDTLNYEERHGPDDEKASYYAYPHHPSIEALRAAATTEGCHLCAQILSELFHIRGHESDEARHQGPIELRCYRKNVNRGDGDGDGDGGDLLLPPAEHIVAVARTPHRDVKVVLDLVRYDCTLASLLKEKASNAAPSLGCEENIKLAMMWLNRCLTTHGLCALSTHPNPSLPTRVLDVGPSSERNSRFVRLCRTEGRRWGPYITLSHVWGQKQIITTTLSTVQDRLVAISIESMPRTFRDAIQIARKMAIRYLWIDSLCIIQDCSEDWEKESSRMGEYYMNSLFNIAAVSASNGDGGCFMNRNPLTLTPCPVRIRLPGITPEELFPCFLRPDISWDPVNETTGFQRPPLWQRAWVVQERLLSARLFRFSDMQLSWRCRVEEASERVPEGTSRPIGVEKGNKLLQEAFLGLKKFALTYIADDMLSSKVNPATGTALELMELYNAWYDLVALYGKCSLTKEPDIFPAISGIAKAIATATGDGYVAGLWQHDLHRGLMWTAPDSTLNKPDLRQYRAPSWSWASLRATCTFHVRQILQTGRVRTQPFKIDEVVLRTSENNLFGEVTSGELKVSALLKRAHPRGVEGEEPFRKISGDNDRQSLFGLEQGLAIGYYYPDNVDKRYLTEVWCSPVMTEEVIPSAKDRNHEEMQKLSRPVQAQCLALYPVNSAESLYMRVGFAWVRDFGWFGGCDVSSFSII